MSMSSRVLPLPVTPAVRGASIVGTARTARVAGAPPAARGGETMVGRVLRFIRLPLLLVVIWTVARFTLGMKGVPYAPRGNAMFSIVGLTFISSFYFGALSRRVGGFGWGGTLLTGYFIGLAAQVLIFTATWLSYAM